MGIWFLQLLLRPARKTSRDNLQARGFESTSRFCDLFPGVRKVTIYYYLEDASVAGSALQSQSDPEFKANNKRLSHYTRDRAPLCSLCSTAQGFAPTLSPPRTRA